MIPKFIHSKNNKNVYFSNELALKSGRMILILLLQVYMISRELRCIYLLNIYVVDVNPTEVIPGTPPSTSPGDRSACWPR